VLVGGVGAAKRSDAGVQRGKALLPDRPKLPIGERREGRQGRRPGRVEGWLRGRECPLLGKGCNGKGEAPSLAKERFATAHFHVRGSTSGALLPIESGNVMGCSALSRLCNGVFLITNEHKGSRHGDSWRGSELQALKEQ
jgi:hypothetical protein